MNTSAMIPYTIRADFLPLNRAFTLDSPKKYQPIMVEKAKNSRQIATNALPKPPKE